jgi:hypothetical protein
MNTRASFVSFCDSFRLRVAPRSCVIKSEPSHSLQLIAGIPSCRLPFTSTSLTEAAIQCKKRSERGLSPFVKSNYGILILLELEKRVTALKVYTVTDKVADVKAELKKGL